MENLGKLTLFLIMIVCASLTSLLGVKVIISIANLYGIEFVKTFSFVQVYGILILFGILKYKPSEKESDEKEKTTTEQAIKNGFISVFEGLMHYLIVWGLGFLMFYILS